MHIAAPPLHIRGLGHVKPDSVDKARDAEAVPAKRSTEYHCRIRTLKVRLLWTRRSDNSSMIKR